VTVILDNEAVQALWSAEHRKHRRALSYVQVVAVRKRKGRAAEIVVPIAVRVEAGWDRSAAKAAFINLLGVRDVPLDQQYGNRAAAIAAEHGVSVADAHVGATAQLMPEDAGPVTIISSDPDDMRAVAGSRRVIIIKL
jgi:predicted nucleic acid-binding protein